MSYVVIEDFRAGLDRRKLPATSPQGSLQKLINAHINRGGEIEKRLAWVPKYALPAGATFGFAGANGVLYTFGSDPSTVTPAGITYQALAHPSALGMTSVTKATFFDGKVFAAAVYTNGDSLCFYDGTRVTDWDAGSGAAVAGRAASDILTVKKKVYASTSSLLAFSSVSQPTQWQAGSGYGFINMSNEAAGSELLVGLGRYQGNLAILARRSTQIWYVDPDPLQNAQRQVLDNIGTFAPKSIISFGDIDMFFLGDTGVRSLRARDSSNQAGVSDVGTPIDDEIITYFRTLTDEVKSQAAAVLEPLNGRYILSIGPRAYVFSYYSSSKISAWSRYDLDFTVSDYVSMDGRIWARAGDTIYLYGGEDGVTYDSSTVEVELPYIDAHTIATWKNWSGLDIVGEGEWAIFMNTDVERPEAETQIGIVSGTTLSRNRIGLVSSAPVIKLRLVNTRPGPAKLAKIILHYDLADAT